MVPQQNAIVVERLGRYHATLNAGFHLLVPFVDVIRYRHSLKEQAIDIPAQVCITRDNVQVGVDGILYLKVLDPERASYGISNYTFAIIQLAQTTLRSMMGKIDLDRTFEERSSINTEIVSELDKASEAWGVKVLRYEIKNIEPPADIIAAMEKQMRAEREKRAVVLQSEGQRDAAINTAEGEKQQVIKASEAKRQQQINEAEGQASAITAVATATAQGLREVASAIQSDGGRDAVQLRVAEQYVTQFGQLARKTTAVDRAGQPDRRGRHDCGGDAGVRDGRRSAGRSARRSAGRAAAAASYPRPMIRTKFLSTPRHAEAGWSGVLEAMFSCDVSQRSEFVTLRPAKIAVPMQVPVPVVGGARSSIVPTNCVSGDVPATVPLIVPPQPWYVDEV